MFSGGTDATVTLAHHIRSKLKRRPHEAPGIATVLHWRRTVKGKTRAVSLDPRYLPARLQSGGVPLSQLFEVIVQADGAAVYTDVRMHVGRGICSINTAWNIMPLSLMERDQVTKKRARASTSTGSESREDTLQLGSCSPCTFSRIVADLARGEAGEEWSNAATDGVTPLLVPKLADWRQTVQWLGLPPAEETEAKKKVQRSVSSLQQAESRALKALGPMHHGGPSKAQAKYMANRFHQCTRCGGGIWHQVACLFSPR